jgi:septum site-determining protein MinC
MNVIMPSALTPSPAFELKGNLLSLLVLRIFQNDYDVLCAQLLEKLTQAPQFFQNAPLVLELHTSEPLNFSLSNLVEFLRQHRLMPVAIRGGNLEQQAEAIKLGLGILPEAKEKSSRREATPNNTAAKIITQPVRSGQQVFAPHGDLIILSTVSAGAEVLAHRHIHVYGTLRGRALAGVNGDVQARIFCQHLDPELVSIAGQYQISDDIPETMRGKAAQIYCEEEQLKIQVLEPYPR